MEWLRHRLAYAALFALGLAVFAGTSAGRLAHRSTDPHFIFQAHAWLNGQLSVNPLPRGADDPARVETVELHDGRIIRGRRLATSKNFRTTQSETVPVSDIRRSVKTTHYVSFPPVSFCCDASPSPCFWKTSE